MEVKAIEVTLNRAHKLVGRIKDQISAVTAEIRTLCEPIRITEMNCEIFISENDVELKEKLRQFAELSGDLKNIKSIIGKKNSEVGIDDLLTEKAGLHAELQMYEVMKNCIVRGLASGFTSIQGGQNAVLRQKEDLLTKGQGYGTVTNVMVSPILTDGEFNKDIVDAKIASLKKRGYELDDKLSNLNATRINLELTEYTYSVLYSK